MINVTWENDGKCENCGENKPHCARVDLPVWGEVDGFPEIVQSHVMLCSDCIEDLKKRLS